MKSSKNKHLVFLSQIGGHTGLARAADNLLSRLAAHFRISVVAISHPKDYVCPYAEVIPARLFEDWLGHLAFWKLCQDDPPDVSVLFMDPGPAATFLPSRHASPLVVYCPIDAQNIKEASQLDAFAQCIFLTEWALTEARACGFTGPGAVIGHGVDTALYRPRDRQEARMRLTPVPATWYLAKQRGEAIDPAPHVHLSSDAFLIGNVNRNQPRKRFDLTFLAFRDFLQRTQAPDASLYCHCCPVDYGWDLPQLAQYWGIADRVLFPKQFPNITDPPPEAEMPWVYSALDVQVSTTQGEGFGLTHLEGAACGVSQVVPRVAALAEWPGRAFYSVPALTPSVTTGGSNMVAWAPAVRDVGTALCHLYETSVIRQAYGQAALALAQQPRFAWDGLAMQFHALLLEVIQRYARGT